MVIFHIVGLPEGKQVMIHRVRFTGASDAMIKTMANICMAMDGIFLHHYIYICVCV